MKKMILLLLISFPIGGFAQTVHPLLNQLFKKNTSTTRALVIGISDYQQSTIPDLKFAQQDALVFADFLASPNGGQLQTNQIKLLTNESATYINIVAALEWLIDETKKDDQCIIYFSGHSDIETKTHQQLGFLLPWDSPSKNYITGALPLFYLKEIITALSLVKKAKVLVIADAIKNKKMGGNAIMANLSQQYANEVKILAYQPEEYSLEKSAWGAGQSFFSYHLINGLNGQADANNDYKINLLEIGHYLEDMVSKDNWPDSQTPITVGIRNYVLSIMVEGN